jgi:hypothetical protein
MLKPLQQDFTVEHAENHFQRAFNVTQQFYILVLYCATTAKSVTKRLYYFRPTLDFAGQSLENSYVVGTPHTLMSPFLPSFNVAETSHI